MQHAKTPAMKLSVVTPLWQDRPAAENLKVAQLADQLGYRELWMGEMATYDAFALATAVGQCTKNIALTVGPLAVSLRSPATIAMGIASVADLTGRETHVALGTSSAVVVEEWHGRERRRGAKHLDETAQIVRSLLHGEKTSFEGELARCRGFRLRLDAPRSNIAIAAFGPVAVKVAARRADRMLLNMVTPASLAALRRQMLEAADEDAHQGTPHKSKTAPSVCVWLPTAIDPAREDIDQMKRGIVGYLAAPGYGEMMMEAGFTELVEFARTRPHPKELLAAMPDELISTLGLVGSAAAVDERLAAYASSGADEICLVPATASDPAGEKTLRAMRSRTG